MKEQIAQLHYLKMAPRKVRLVAQTLKGLSVGEAEAQLLLRTQRARVPLLKLLRSAVANAKNNQKLDPQKLVVRIVRVDKGPMLKRVLPRAQGRATPIHKIMSHVTLILSETEKSMTPRFIIAPPPKKEKKEKKPSTNKPKTPEAREGTPHQEKKKGGFLKRIFRRKSI